MPSFPKREKYGGRQRGTPNKRTIEKMEQAERGIVETRKRGKKLAKERLEEIMELAGGLAAHFVPVRPEGQRPNPNANEPLFAKYFSLYLDAARYLAPYQSPTFRAIMIAPPAPEKTMEGEKVRRYRIGVFDHAGKPIPAEMMSPTTKREQ